MKPESKGSNFRSFANMSGDEMGEGYLPETSCLYFHSFQQVMLKIRHFVTECKQCNGEEMGTKYKI